MSFFFTCSCVLRSHSLVDIARSHTAQNPVQNHVKFKFLDLTHFSDKELQGLLTLREGVECETHDLLGCQCDGRGVLPHELETNDINPVEVNLKFLIIEPAAIFI